MLCTIVDYSLNIICCRIIRIDIQILIIVRCKIIIDVKITVLACSLCASSFRRYRIGIAGIYLRRDLYIVCVGSLSAAQGYHGAFHKTCIDKLRSAFHEVNICDHVAFIVFIGLDGNCGLHMVVVVKVVRNDTKVRSTAQYGGIVHRTDRVELGGYSRRFRSVNTAYLSHSAHKAEISRHKRGGSDT